MTARGLSIHTELNAFGCKLIGQECEQSHNRRLSQQHATNRLLPRGISRAGLGRGNFIKTRSTPIVWPWRWTIRVTTAESTCRRRFRSSRRNSWNTRNSRAASRRSIPASFYKFGPESVIRANRSLSKIGQYVELKRRSKRCWSSSIKSIKGGRYGRGLSNG